MTLYANLVVGAMTLGFYIGHFLEIVAVLLIGVPAALDIKRAGASRPLVGDLTATELVASEEAYLGPRVRAPTPSLERTSPPRSTNSPSPAPAAGAASVTSAKRDEAAARPPTPCRGGVVRDDHLHDDVGASERGQRDARVARRARAHRVEQVRNRAHAAVEGQVGLGRGGIGVPRRDRHVALDELVDQLERAGQLGRQRHVRDGPGVEQPPQQREVGRREPARVVDAGAAGREERAFDVGADHARAEPPVGIARSASSSAASGAVTNVGWNAVVPVASSASPTRA